MTSERGNPFGGWLVWICEDCGHKVLSMSKPGSLHWKDNHVCRNWVCLQDVLANKKEVKTP